MEASAIIEIAIGISLSSVLGVFAWSLKRNIRQLDHEITELKDMNLTQTSINESLKIMAETAKLRMDYIEKRVDTFESKIQ